MSIISWIILGLLVGAIAKLLLPGRDPGGILGTTLIGIVGAFLGGWLSSRFLDRPISTDFYDTATWVAAIMRLPGAADRLQAALRQLPRTPLTFTPVRLRVPRSGRRTRLPRACRSASGRLRAYGGTQGRVCVRTFGRTGMGHDGGAPMQTRAPSDARGHENGAAAPIRHTPPRPRTAAHGCEPSTGSWRTARRSRGPCP